MKQLNFVNAIISSFVLLVLASFVMGLQLQLDGTRLWYKVLRKSVGCGLVPVVWWFFASNWYARSYNKGLKKSQARRGCCQF